MDIWELKAYMKDKAISQIDLAKRSSIPLQTLRKIFSGQTAHPRIDTMQAIEKALGLADNSPLDGGKVLTDKEKRLLQAFNSLIEPLKDFAIETIENLAQQSGKAEKGVS